MSAESPRLLTLKQIAAELQVTRRTVNRYIESGQLPVIRISTQNVRVERSDFEKFLRVRRG